MTAIDIKPVNSQAIDNRPVNEGVVDTKPENRPTLGLHPNQVFELELTAGMWMASSGITYPETITVTNDITT